MKRDKKKASSSTAENSKSTSSETKIDLSKISSFNDFYSHFKRYSDLYDFFEGSLEEGMIIVEYSSKKIIYANQAVAKLLGYSVEELLSMEIMDIHPREVFEFTAPNFVGEHQSKTSYAPDIPCIKKDKSIINLSINVRKININNTEYILGFVRHRKSLENLLLKLAENEEQYKIIANNTNHAIAIIDYNGVVKFINTLGAAVHGKTPEECIGKNLSFFFPDDIVKEYLNNIRNVIDSKQPYRHEEEAFINNQKRWIVNTLQPIKGLDGRITSCMIISSDVTEYRQEKERLKFLSLAIEQSMDGIAVTDLDGTIKYVNKAWAKMHDISDEEIIGKNISVFHTEEQLVNDVMLGSKIFIEQGFFEGEIGHKKKNGETFMTWMSTSSLRDQNNKLIGAVGIARDITQEKIIKDRLTESKAKYRSIFDNVGIALATAEKDTIISLVNDEFEKLSGYSKNEIIDRMKWTDFVHPDDIEQIKTTASHVIRNKKAALANYEFRLIDKNKKIKYMKATSSMMPNSETSLTSFLDITDIRKAEEVLKESETKFRTLVDQTPAIIYMAHVDESSSTSFVSSQVESLIGFTPEEYKNDPDIWFKQIHHEDRERVIKEYHEAISNNKDFLSEYRMIRKDGKIVYFQDRCRIVYDSQNKPLYTLGIMIDISEIKRSELEKTAFSNLSHKLTAPIDLQEIGKLIAIESRRLFGHDAFWVNLYDKEKCVLFGGYCEDTLYNMNEPIEIITPEPLIIDLSKSELIQGIPQLVNRPENQDNTEFVPYGEKTRLSRSLMFAPVFWDKKMIGIMSCQSYTPNKYTTKDLKVLMTLSDQCAGALARVQVYRSLYHSEERYKKLLNSVTDYIYTVYLDQGKPTETKHSPACEAVTGYTADEFNTNQYLWLNIIHPDDRDFVLEKILTFLRGKNIQPFEHRIFRKDEQIRWIRTTLVPYYDTHGDISSYDGMVQDITERKNAQLALEESESRYRAIIEDQMDLICRYNREGIVTYVNNAYSNYFGINPSDIIGNSIYQFIPDSDKEIVKKNILSLSKDNPVKIYEHKVVDKNGDTRWQEWRDRILIDEKTGFVEYQAVGRDVTERKLFEETLKRNRDQLEKLRQQYQAVLLCTPHGLCVLDRYWNIVYSNRALGEILKSSADTEKLVIGQSFDRFFLNEINFNDFKKAVKKSFIELKPFNQELLLRRLNGEMFWCELSVVKIDPTDTTPGYVATLIDITSRKHDESDKERIQKHLLQVQKMEAVALLAGGIAHDFNNMLTIIRGFTEILITKSKDNDVFLDYLKRIYDSSESAIELIKQLRILGSQTPLDLIPINLNDSVIKYYKVFTKYMGEEIKIVLDLEPDIWTILADKTNIAQIIMNLSLNSRDAMPKGGTLTIKTSNELIDIDYVKKHPQAYIGRFVCLSISDTGIGISEGIKDRLFEPFFTTKESGKGSGLGLPTVYSIVKQHNGFINYESIPNVNTTFFIYFPEFSKSAKSKSDIPLPTEDLIGKGEKILLVEDDENVRVLALKILKDYNYIVYGAKNGKEALDIFADNQGDFHLVFSDVVLPDMNGVLLIDKILTQKASMNILITTAYADEKCPWDLIRDKNYRFLPKPYSVYDLLKIVRRTINQSN